jgi:uncharacterized protein (TIGR02421 family)
MSSPPTTLCTEDLAVDRELADIAQSFRFLLDVTPVNVGDARKQFLSSTATEPPFDYRDIEDDPEVIRKRLDAVAVDTVADPTTCHLLKAKRRELELQLEMLRARGTADFRALGIELYGTVSPALLEQAEVLLGETDAGRRPSGAWCDAASFARRADAELDHYRALVPDLVVHVEIRDDCSSIMVSNGDLLVPSSLRVAEDRVDALLQHEIGTHIVTYVNGSCQPLRVLACGLAGYEETQEGLAVLAEHLIGRLTVRRLRQLAARVVAVHEMVDGRSFRAVHRHLVDVGFTATEAFSIVMRVYRSGGLTKDAVYLRGLTDLVAHIGAGQSIDVLWLGKMALAAAPLVEELHRRGALVGPRLCPRYLDYPAARSRIAGIDETTSLVDLIERAA